ncbi:MAG: acyltransferase family protein [Thalassotalea sp.]
MTVHAKGNLGTAAHTKQTSKAKNNQYLPALTALRGIAALWVVLFHMDVIIFYRELGTLLPHQWTGLITQGYLWVDFFFILSGFIICHIYGEQLSSNLHVSKIKGYLFARFFRIYPLHLFTLILLIGLVFVITTFAPTVIDDSWLVYFDWQALLSNIFLTNAMNQHTYLSWNIVSWSIGAEWWAYLYAIGLLYFIGNRQEKVAMALAAAALIGLVLLVTFYPKKNLDITFDYGFLRCLFEFTLGVSSYQLYKQNIAHRFFQQDHYFILTLLALIAIFHWRLHDLFTIPLFVILVLCAAHNQGKILSSLSAASLQFLGRISYSIYLMHGVWFMVYWFLLPVLKRSGHIEIWSLTHTAMFAVSFIALTILSAMCSYRFIEVPFRFSGKKISTKNSFNNNKPLEVVDK